MSCQAKKAEGFCPMAGHCPMKKKDKESSLDKSELLDNGPQFDKDTCPNSDPGFNKIIGERTPEERSKLFIVCVLVRTLLYSGVYVYRDKPWMAPLVAVLASMAMFQMYTSDSPDGRQWWSKKFQLFMAILVLIAALLVKFKGFDSRSMAGLLFISLLGGILQRSQVKFC
jgi:hypothetical protein